MYFPFSFLFLLATHFWGKKKEKKRSPSLEPRLNEKTHYCTLQPCGCGNLIFKIFLEQIFGLFFRAKEKDKYTRIILASCESQ
jgi:hypothetical protein